MDRVAVRLFGIFVLLKTALHRDIWPITVVVTFYLLVTIALWATGSTGLSFQSHYSNMLLTFAGLFFPACIYLIVRLLKIRPSSPFAFIKTDIQLRLRLTQLAQAMPILAALNLFSPAFSGAKQQVGRIYPYTWDMTFVHWDKIIHGDDPWRILQHIIGYPPVTFTFAMAYQFWILLIYVGTPLIAVALQNERLRQQFLLTYLFGWIVVGSIMANFFASVGPCFLHAYTGSDHFNPLMDYLQFADTQYPILVLDVQAKLLSWQHDGSGQLGRGISAMPSMHVCIATLFMLVGWQSGKFWRWASALFFVMILVGSVHLAYHYAVDGYVSIIVTAIIWKLAGWWATRSEANTPALRPSLTADHH